LWDERLRGCRKQADFQEIGTILFLRSGIVQTNKEKEGNQTSLKNTLQFNTITEAGVMGATP
jgi:hypothetical protein